jgi:predicted nuclease of restriction endonuclease-like (RecB) superfamily
MNALLAVIRELILAARKAVVHSVDLVQVVTNFEIGRRIVEYEQQGSERAQYGKALLRKLSLTLSEEFGRGFSHRNLEYMRRFYLTFKDRAPRISQIASAKLQSSQESQKTSGELELSEKTQRASAQFTLSWSQYVFLISIENADERSFYEIEASANSWTLPELKRQFNSGLYERLALSRDKDEIRKLAQEGQIITKPHDLLKEPYVLEFLGLDEKSKYSESDLESAIIDKLERFLLELGKGFLFEARQRRFTFGEEHFFIDLVFYNRLLRCYILLDLKIGKLTHQNLGQMQMYVNYFDRYVKLEDENSTIGIILCKKKHDALVEITLPKDANIQAKEYQLYLPDKEELKLKLLEWAKESERSH